MPGLCPFAPLETVVFMTQWGKSNRWEVIVPQKVPVSYKLKGRRGASTRTRSRPRSRSSILILLLAPVAAGLLAACDNDQHGARYPNRPIKIVVPFAAGGGTDTFARLFKKAIEDHRLLPQPTVIINVDGAGGTIGSRRVKTARPDGYTVLLLHQAILTAKYYGTVPYGPEAFTPVAATGEIGLIIAVPRDAPHRDLRDLLESARAPTAGPAFGANLGAPSHFVGLQLERIDPDARFRFVQTGGGARRFAALRGGHIDVTVFSIEEYVRFSSGGARGVAYMGADRHEAVPDVPTATEQGFDLFNRDMHFWWVPEGTPRARIETLATALEAACETEFVKQRLAEIFCEPIFLRGEKLAQRLAALEGEISGIVTRRPVAVPDFPGLILGSVAFLTLLVLWRSRREHVPLPAASPPDGVRRRVDVAAACFALIVAYVAVMTAEWASFRPATFVYVLLTGSTLTRKRRNALPILVVLAAAMSFGVHYLFTRVFVIDLP